MQPTTPTATSSTTPISTTTTTKRITTTPPLIECKDFCGRSAGWHQNCPQSDLGMQWSSAGAITGKHCTHIVESADPFSWHDHYLCFNNDYGIRWSSAGDISGMNCAKIIEIADPFSWHDNFLCVPNGSSFQFKWSSANAIASLCCLHMYEPADPFSWHDNYLCRPQYDGTETKPDFVNLGFDSYLNQKPVLEPLPAPVPQRTTNDDYGRQTGSVSGGFLLMTISGLHIGWVMWRTFFIGLSTLHPSEGLIYFTIMAWSVGAFIGGFIGSALTPKLRKNTIYYASAAAMIVGNVLFIIWDEHIEAIIVVRLLVGGAHGIAYVALITQAGENASRNMRGNVLSTVNCYLYLGIFISVFITGTVRLAWFGADYQTISAERIVAIANILLAGFSIACTIMRSIETVPFVLNKNDRHDAMINLKYLRGWSLETLELREEMEELNTMVIQSNYESRNIFSEGNFRPLVLMVAMRLMVALTNNLLINDVAFIFVSLMFYSFQYRYILIVVVAPRFFMSLVQVFYAGFFRRKIQFFVSASLAGLIIIVIGILLNTLNIPASGQMNNTYGIVFGALFLTFQLVCGIGMDQMQDVYLSEASTIAKKPWSISFVAGIEHLFHILMIGMYFLVDIHLDALSFATGAMVIVFGIILVFALPETRKMSLKQANESLLKNAINLTSPFA